MTEEEIAIVERAGPAVQRILHGNAPEPAPAPKKTRKTRSDAGTKRPAKVDAMQPSLLDGNQIGKLDALIGRILLTREAKLKAARDVEDAERDYHAYLNLLQGK